MVIVCLLGVLLTLGCGLAFEEESHRVGVGLLVVCAAICLALMLWHVRL